jgi:CRP/FNR family transcriptional regulator, cyclic AMP receptor protein
MDTDELRRLSAKLTPGRWFGGLPAELQQLILSGSRVRDYAKGQVIGLEGQATTGLRAVLEGQVQVVRRAGMDDEGLVYVGGQGFWFGEYAVLMDAPEVLVSVIARTKARILFLPKAEFERIVRDEPRYFREFAKLAFARMAALLRAYAQASSLAPEERLRGQLALLTQLKIEEQSLQGAVDLPLSQADLAAIVGVSRQTINPMLGTLADRGLIELGFRRIRILDPRGLSVDDRPLAAAGQRSLHRTEVATAAAARLEDSAA